MKFRTLLLTAAAALASGCAETSPNWESRFGDAARQAAALQVIDPAASSRTAALRTDGKATSGSLKAYADSFGYAVKEAKQPEIAITPTQGR